MFEYCVTLKFRNGKYEIPKSSVSDNIVNFLEHRKDLKILIFDALKNLRPDLSKVTFEEKNYLLSIIPLSNVCCDIHVFLFLEEYRSNFLMNFTSEKNILKQILNLNDYGIVIIQNEKVIFINKTMEKMGGYGLEEVVGKNFIDFFDEKEKRKILKIHRKRVFTKNEEPERTWKSVLVKKNGEKMYVECNVARTIFENEDAVVATVKDLTHYRKLLNVQHDRYYYDDMTKTMNRNRLVADFPKIHRKYVGICDLIRFKFINDKFGYVYGDNLIRKFANFLKEQKIVEKVYRLGGDEFFLVFSKNDICEIRKFFEFANEISKETRFRLVIAEKRKSFRTTMEILDFCMTESKEKFVNFLFFDKEKETIFRNRKKLFSAKNEEILDNIYISFQKIFDRNSNLKGFEILSNFRSFSSSKEDIFREIYKNGLSIEFMNRILEKISLFVSEKNSKNERIHINIDYSFLGNQFENFFALLKNYERTLNSSRLILEITEEYNILSEKEYIFNLLKLHENSYRFALDDMGRKYSSLEYVLNIPFDMIKFDQKFSFELEKENSKVENLFSKLVSVLKNDHILVLEGIENENSYRKALKYDIDELQGFFLHKPENYDFRR